MNVLTVPEELDEPSQLHHPKQLSQAIESDKANDTEFTGLVFAFL